MIDLRGNIPTVVIVTGGQTHEVKILDQLVWEAGAIYLMDRGYVDFRDSIASISLQPFL